jgi:hypothetical protein
MTPSQVASQKNALVALHPFWQLVEEKISFLGLLQQGSVIRTVCRSSLSICGINAVSFRNPCQKSGMWVWLVEAYMTEAAVLQMELGETLG